MSGLFFALSTSEIVMVHSGYKNFKEAIIALMLLSKLYKVKIAKNKRVKLII